MIPVLLLGCVQNPFIREIEVEQEIGDEKYSLTANWSLQDSLLKVYMSQTTSLSSTEYSEVKDAIITVEQNLDKYQFEYNPVSKYYESKASLKQSGLLALRVETSDSKTLISSSQFPEKSSQIIVTNINDIKMDNRILEDGLLRISIADNLLDKNYYIIEIEGEGIDESKPDLGQVFRKFVISSDHPNVEYSSLYKVFVNDVNVNGEDLMIPIKYNSFFLSNLQYINVKIRTINKDGYLFELTSEKVFQSTNNPLSEPILIKSNIENGVGIFSLQHEKLIQIR